MLYLQDKCWDTTRQSNISHLTRLPQTRLQWETLTLALWPRNCTIALCFVIWELFQTFFSPSAVTPPGVALTVSEECPQKEWLWSAVIEEDVPVHHTGLLKNGWTWLLSECDDHGMRPTPELESSPAVGVGRPDMALLLCAVTYGRTHVRTHQHTRECAPSKGRQTYPAD